jgi:hypothetical protein
MKWIRNIILLFMVFFLLFEVNPASKPAAVKDGKVKQAQKRHPKPRPVKKRPPDPELAWRDCGEYCLHDIFESTGANIKIPRVKGSVKNFAIYGELLYLLVQDFNLITDAIFIIKRDSGMIQSIWGIGRHSAEAIACEGKSLVVLSRSNKYFMRRLSLRGKGIGDVGSKSLPEGDVNGLAVVDGNLIFASNTEEGSNIYLFSPYRKTMKKMYTFRGKIKSIVFFQNKLMAYLNEFDTYWNNWLVIINMKDGQKKRMCFVDTVPSGFAADGKGLYMLENSSEGIFIYPFAVLVERSIVLSNPLIRRVEIDFPMVNGNSNPFSADLWIPYPINRRFQNIRKVLIEPQPQEIVQDRYGNRWAHIRWERENKSVTALLKFDIRTSDVAYTLPGDRPAMRERMHSDNPPASLSETFNFDISNYIVQSHSTRIDMKGPFLSRILAIRRYIRAAVHYAGQNERWSKASEYLFKGRGDAYGSAISFAAIARFLGIPARAAGGLLLDTAGSSGIRNDQIWNQVYFTDIGWADIGNGANDYIAYRSKQHFITFEGDFDKTDYASVFAETDWLAVRRWSSADENRKAEVAVGRMRVRVQDLKE